MSSVSTSLPLEQRSAVWSDTEIQAVLDASGQDVYLAASKLLIVLAANRSLLVQSRKVGKAELDYGGIRKDLLAQAAALRQISIETPADGLAEVVWTDFDMRQIITNVILRQSV
jgi:hypothetical protein